MMPDTVVWSLTRRHAHNLWLPSLACTLYATRVHGRGGMRPLCRAVLVLVLITGDRCDRHSYRAGGACGAYLAHRGATLVGVDYAPTVLCTATAVNGS